MFFFIFFSILDSNKSCRDLSTKLPIIQLHFAMSVAKAQIEVVSCVRNFSWLSLSDSFPEEVIRECKALFDERVTKRYDYIREVCRSFENWSC